MPVASEGGVGLGSGRSTSSQQPRVPARHGTRGDQQLQRGTVTLAQQPEQGREHRAVPVSQGRLGTAALQDGQLVAEYQYLGILGRGRATQQAQPAEQVAAESGDQTERHAFQACIDGLANTPEVITS